ncbi:MAG: DUF1638 domain-containing protein [Acetivibrionales bacterium]|jgi:hypothetical protein
MNYKLICCEVFMRMACLAIAHTPHIIDPEFTELGAHEDPEKLRDDLQKRVDKADACGKYDAILLGYGLCGNGTVGIKAGTVPLVIPRAHDCCTIFLGSKDKFIEYFKDNLSSEWSSVGYMERGSDYLRDTDTGKLLGMDKDFEQLVEQYGEENAEFIWETLHPKPNNNEIIFIEVPELAHLGYLSRIKSLAEKEGKTLQVFKGDMALINGLIQGNWNDRDYLIVSPGKKIKAIYDQNKVMCTD